MKEESILEKYESNIVFNVRMRIKMDWNEVMNAQSLDELKKAKLWLFQENIRLQNEKNSIDEMQDKFIQEKARFRKDMDALNHRIVVEQKRLKEESLFFEKKMEILQEGFRKLEEDKKRFNKEKKLYETNQSYQQSFNVPGKYINMDEFVGVLFRNTNSLLSLRKRYRDLMKIFHPDNNSGDAELVQLINKEFARRKEEYQ